MSGTDKDDDKTSGAANPWANAAPRTSKRSKTAETDSGDRPPAVVAREKRTPDKASKGDRPVDRMRRGGAPSAGSSGPWAKPGAPRGEKANSGYKAKGGEQQTFNRKPPPESPRQASAKTPARTEDIAAGLVRELSSRLQSHPSGALVRARRETVPITLEVPISLGKDRLANFKKDLETSLDAAVLSLVSERQVAESGTAYCLRCSESDCEHSKPTPRQVFVSYGPTGMPQFEDYSQALLDLGDPGMGQLFGGSGRVVTRLWSEQELNRQLLPSFEESETGYRVLGQVTAGWYWVPSGYQAIADHNDEEVEMESRNFALSFQLAVIDVKGQPRRLTLNTIGTSPAGGSLEDLHDAFGELPWESARRWCRSSLADVERSLRRAGRPRKPKAKKTKGVKKTEAPQVVAPEEVWHERSLRILAGFERRLLRRERSNQRKTRHAEKRRKQKRPTGHALSDLAAAGDESVLRDTRNGTFVVLGDKGRTHIFNEGGRLVTSIVYPAEAITRRMERGFWAVAEGEVVAGFREAAASGSR